MEAVKVVNKSFTVGAGSNISGTITYTISGSFTWDRATGKITVRIELG